MATSTTAECAGCGEPFIRKAGEEWKRKCFRCWWSSLSSAEQSRRKAQWDKDTEFNFKNDKQEETRQSYNRNATPLEAELKGNLNLLIQLCHPDKHGGSPASNKATVWLLEMKRRLV